MKAPKPHPRELERLKILSDLDILDSPPEAQFDFIAQLASQICQAPIAKISIVDQNRQWFKAKVGITLNETSRDISFCGHAINEDNLFQVTDARSDSRFSDNPLVTGDPHVVFYSGAQIREKESQLPIGVLCVIDHKPRQLTEQQIHSLQLLAHQAELLIELHKSNKILTNRNQHLEFFDIVLKNMNEGVVSQEPSGRIIQANAAAANILCMTPDQLLGKTSLDPDWRSVKEDGSPFPGEQHPAMMALKTGNSQKDVIMGVGTQSQDKWIRISSIPVKNSSGNTEYAITTFSDITEIREAQSVAVDNARMASIGDLAAGIAHEINNPLAIIDSNLVQLEKCLSKDPLDKSKVQSHHENIKQTSRRIAKIIKSLLLISRDGSKDIPSKVKIALLVDNLIKVMEQRFQRHGIKVQNKVAADAVVITNETHLFQVLTHLLNNAIEALSKTDNKWIEIGFEKNGDKSFLHVTDSGKGIPVEAQKRIFQPFFTTKQVGQGIGLGLSVSRGMCQSMGGDLSLDTQHPNTRFSIHLADKY